MSVQMRLNFYPFTCTQLVLLLRFFTFFFPMCRLTKSYSLPNPKLIPIPLIPIVLPRIYYYSAYSSICIFSDCPAFYLYRAISSLFSRKPYRKQTTAEHPSLPCSKNAADTPFTTGLINFLRAFRLRSPSLTSIAQTNSLGDLSPVQMKEQKPPVLTMNLATIQLRSDFLPAIISFTNSSQPIAAPQDHFKGGSLYKDDNSYIAYSQPLFPYLILRMQLPLFSYFPSLEICCIYFLRDSTNDFALPRHLLISSATSCPRFTSGA